MVDKDKNKTKVGLVQIGDKFGEQYYLPYSIGTLQAYAQKYANDPGSFDFITPIYRREKLSDSSQYLAPTDIVFFSVYIWNYKISLAIAKVLKSRREDLIVVFGGPQIPETKEKLEAFLKKNPQVDLACYGEGEITFVKILDNFKDRSWNNVPSIGYIDGNGRFVFTQAAKRVSDLNEIPSPYLEGIFDPLINKPDEKWSALIETNRGCPFTCAFCYWGSKTKSKVFQFDQGRVFKEIDWISDKKIEFVFCCDANFGILPRDAEIAAKIADNKKRYGYPKAFSVQNMKNSSDKIFAIQKMLNDFGLQKGVNLALQSVNEETLKNIKRKNIRSKVYAELQKKFVSEKIATFSDMIIGLPGETYDTFTEGVSFVIESGQHNRIQFINLVLLENTAMSDRYYIEKFGLVIRESDIFPHHTTLGEAEEVSETQDLVVGTAAMPVDDWVKTRVFCWIISLLYFNKLLQIPFALINALSKVTYKELAEVFMLDDWRYPAISEIFRLFRGKADGIKNGGQEHIQSKEWLNIWWPADEYIFIKLCARNEIDKFYNEAETLLKEKFWKAGNDVIAESVKLNKSLIKRPFVETDLSIKVKHNIYEVYQCVLNGKAVPLKTGEYVCTVERSREKWVTLDDWCKEVVWYGTKKGAYLYGCRQIKE